MPRFSVLNLFGLLVVGALFLSASPAEARYTGSQPACVTGVDRGDRLSVRMRPSASSPRIGWLSRKACGFNIESVDGNWTYIRGADYRGRNIQGFVNNRFLRARSAQTSNPGSGGVGGYTGTDLACVTNVRRGDRLAVRTRPRRSSRRKGWLGRKACGFNVEAVDGRWTYIRGSDYRGRKIQGWVNNRFLRARTAQTTNPGNGGGDGGVFPVRAATGGGSVRTGPGTNFRKIGSLGEFERITVIRNTGVNFNGYPWFEIRFRGGRKGFQWGGIICSEAVPFQGTFDTCNNFRRSLSGNNTTGGGSVAPQRRAVSYNCNEGIPLDVTFIEENGESYALYTHDSGPKIRVAARPSGSGFLYTNGYHELRGKGQRIDLIEGGSVLDSCRVN